MTAVSQIILRDFLGFLEFFTHLIFYSAVNGHLVLLEVVISVFSGASSANLCRGVLNQGLCELFALEARFAFFAIVQGVV